jgi:hypothetical protein
VVGVEKLGGFARFSPRPGTAPQHSGLGVDQSGFKGDPQTVPLILDGPSPTWPNFTTNYTNRVERAGSRKHLHSTFRQDFSPPYAVSRESAPWSQLPRRLSLPTSPRPTILTLVPNIHDPYSANSMKPILDEKWPAWPADHLLQDRTQSAPCHGVLRLPRFAKALST